MIKGIKKERVRKTTNRKQSLKKFIESGYTDIQAFLNACKNDENLLIYQCLEKDELQAYIDKLKDFDTVEEKIKYLVNNQPFANETEERFNKVTMSVAKYLKGYIEYNGFRLNNGISDAEDWTSELWAKYCKICNFYRTRWFHPDKLKKPSSVSYTPILYKEFIFISRMSLSGERKHFAFLATQNPEATLFKVSLDTKMDGDSEKTLAEVIPDEDHDVEYMTECSNLNRILEKALLICKQYPDAEKYYDRIKEFYNNQDPIGFDKKTVILGKIFLYKAGLVSPKILSFIKGLSSTYKARYNISLTRIAAQINEEKDKKIVKYHKKSPKESNLGWRELILKKRGELA